MNFKRNKETFERMFITPELAEEMLSLSAGNRKLSPETVKKYQTEMLRDEWDEHNTDSINITTSGVLVNGHHRLHALAGLKGRIKGIHLLVGLGVDDNIHVLDTGKKRSTQDVLVMSGCSKADKYNVALVKMILFQLYGLRNPTDNQVRVYLEQYYPDITKAIQVSQSKYTKNAWSQAAAYYALRCGINPDSISEFFRVIGSGFMDHSWQKPAIIARDAIINFSTIARDKSRYARTTMTDLLVTAMTDYINHTERKKAYSDKSIKTTHRSRVEFMDKSFVANHVL